jgi:hypothetical protein
MAKDNLSKAIQKLIAGKTDAMEIAKLVAKHERETIRIRQIEGARRQDFLANVNLAKKMTYEAMTSVVWEYMRAHAGDFGSWVRENHPELVTNAVGEVTVSD